VHETFARVLPMSDVSTLINELIATLEYSKPNPLLWYSSSSRALELQIDSLQTELRILQHQLIELPRISL
jgi:hypothetical protein